MFLLNYAGTPCEVTVPASRDLLMDKDYGETSRITLPDWGCAILQVKESVQS